MFLKFSFRRNLLHILYLLIWRAVRSFELMIISKLLDFHDSTFYTLPMFIAEFLSGLIIYLYQQKVLSLKKLGRFSYLANRRKMKRRDSLTKQYFLIILCAFFDFVEFIYGSEHLSKFINLSGSIEGRLTGMLTINSALFYFLVMKFKVLKHQKVSLIIMGVTLGIIIITEYIFQKTDIFATYKDLTLAIFIVLLIHIFTSMVDVIEKYLFEFNSLNQFKVLMYEGFFGIIFTLFYYIHHNPFIYFTDYLHTHSTIKNAFLIIAMIIYTLLCVGRNAYRVHVTKIYSPIVKTLTDYFINPIYNIIHFIIKDDFLRDGNRNYAYFILNLIFSLIISFFGCVYNEFIIIFFGGLEKETYEVICERASELENVSVILKDLEKEEESADNDDNWIDNN